MIDYTPAEADMRRLIIVRNQLDMLTYLVFVGKITPSLAAYYGVQHLVQFEKAYRRLMRHLPPEQREHVRCVAGLVSGVIEHSSGLRKVRNNWIAHLQDDDSFAEDASDFIEGAGMPGNPATHCEMHICVVAFVDTLRALLPGIAGPAVEKFNRTSDAEPKFRRFDPNRVVQDARSRLDDARKKAKQKFPCLPWDSLLGAAGVRLGQLGPDDPSAGAARGGGQCKGGEDWQ